MYGKRITKQNSAMGLKEALEEGSREYLYKNRLFHEALVLLTATVYLL